MIVQLTFVVEKSISIKNKNIIFENKSEFSVRYANMLRKWQRLTLSDFARLNIVTIYGIISLLTFKELVWERRFGGRMILPCWKSRQKLIAEL